MTRRSVQRLASSASHAACWAIFLLALACAKTPGDEAAPVSVEPISQSEAERGQIACRAYVELVCACAKSARFAKELAETCHMAPAKVSSLAAVLEVNRTSKDLKERVSTERTAHRIIKSCFDEQSKLLAKGCRPPSGGQGAGHKPADQPAPR